MYKDDWLNPTTKWGSRSYYCLSWNISLMHKLRSSGCPSWDTGRRRNKCRLYALCSVLLYFSWAAVIKLQMFDLTRSACGMCLCVCVFVWNFSLSFCLLPCELLAIQSSSHSQLWLFPEHGAREEVGGSYWRSWREFIIAKHRHKRQKRGWWLQSFSFSFWGVWERWVFRLMLS